MFYQIFFLLLKMSTYQTFPSENSDSNENNCSKTRVFVGDKQFTVYTARKTWLQAVQQCLNENSTIGEIESLAEASTLAQIMTKHRPDTIENIWIGDNVKKIPEKIPKSWMSKNTEILDDDQSRDFLMRNRGLISDNKVGFCLILDSHVFEPMPKIIKIPCDRRRAFICQRFAVRLENKYETSTVALTSKTITENKYFNDSGTTASLEQKGFFLSSTTPRIITTKPIIITTTNVEEDYYNDWEDLRQLSDTVNSVQYQSKNSMLMTTPRGTTTIKFLSTRRIPKLKILSTKKPFIDNLRLYYEFEGPMAAIFDTKQMPSLRTDIRKILIPKYYKYIERKKISKV